MNPKLIELTRPFPTKYVKQVQGQDYVPHGIVEQRLVSIFETTPKVELLREIYDDVVDMDSLKTSRILTGVVMRMTVPEFEPVEEAGECDNPQAKTNGARLKSAASDAYKRCALRLGCGLHLWIGDDGDYFLYESLKARMAELDAEEGSNA